MQGRQILVIDDEQPIIDVVEYVLREDGFQVLVALNGDDGWRTFRSCKPDLVILDLILPGLSGKDLFRLMRDRSPSVPVIMLSCRDAEADRVAGLEVGADDYITKPFSTLELAARVRAVLRRTSGNGGTPAGRLRAGPLEIDTKGFGVTFYGTEVRLTRHEFVILECLMTHPARVFPRGALLDAIYDGETVVTDRSVDAHVKRLRRKLLHVRRRPDPIETVYGIGYKLNRELETPA